MRGNFKALFERERAKSEREKKSGLSLKLRWPQNCKTIHNVFGFFLKDDRREKKENNVTIIWSDARRLCCWVSFTLWTVLRPLRAVVPHGVVLRVGSHPSVHLAT